MATPWISAGGACSRSATRLTAPGEIHPLMALFAVMSIAAGAGASGALNMGFDSDIDAVMGRTARRPVPSGRVSRDEALSLGWILSLISVLVLTAIALVAAGPLMRLLGDKVEAVITRLLGVLLSAVLMTRNRNNVQQVIVCDFIIYRQYSIPNYCPFKSPVSVNGTGIPVSPLDVCMPSMLYTLTLSMYCIQSCAVTVSVYVAVRDSTKVSTKYYCDTEDTVMLATYSSPDCSGDIVYEFNPGMVAECGGLL